MNTKNTKPLSIGGWLILPAIGLLLTSFKTLTDLSGSMSEISSIVLLEIFYIWLIIQFFRRQYCVPRWMIFFYLLNVLGGILLLIFSASEEENIKIFFQSLIAAGIWIPYFYKSKRVQQTFLYKSSQVIKNPNHFKNIWKTLLIGSIIYLIVPFLLVFSEGFFSVSDSRNEIASAVVNIYCESSSEDIEGGGGSGVIINSSGRIVTNAHILPQDEEFYYTHDDGCLVMIPDPETGSPQEMYWAMPIIHPSLSEEYDVALLDIYAAYTNDDNEILGDISSPFPEYLCENYDVKLGDEIRILGYPEINANIDYFNLVITEGIISSMSDDFFLTSAKVEQGNSGGIAVDKDGCMIGIPSGIISGEYQNLGVIIPLEKILEYLEAIVAE